VDLVLGYASDSRQPNPPAAEHGRPVSLSRA
jgi:hypothetical protein